jgi:hypothetical protein
MRASNRRKQQKVASPPQRGLVSEISGSHGGEYEDSCLLESEISLRSIYWKILALHTIKIENEMFLVSFNDAFSAAWVIVF